MERELALGLLSIFLGALGAIMVSRLGFRLGLIDQPRASDKGTALLGHGFPGLRSALDKYTEDMAVDGHRIQDEIGFRPKYDLLSGWKATIEEMRARGEL